MANKHNKGNKKTRPKTALAKAKKELSSGNPLEFGCHQRIIPAKKGGPYNRSKNKRSWSKRL